MHTIAYLKQHIARTGNSVVPLGTANTEKMSPEYCPHHGLPGENLFCSSTCLIVLFTNPVFGSDFTVDDSVLTFKMKGLVGS